MTQAVCASVPDAEVNDIVLFVLETRILPVRLTLQEPAKVTVYEKLPVAVGVPLMVTTLLANDPVTPDGRPENVAPVALLVEYVIVVRAVFSQSDWALVPAAELKVPVGPCVTVMVTDGE